MATRQEQKERKREERLERERAEAQAAKRKRLVAFGGGGLLLVAAVVAVVVVLLSGGGDDAGPAEPGGGGQTALPARQTTGFEEAVKASGGTYRSYPSEGRTHSEQEFTGYRTNPATSGTHNPVPAEDGIYAPGNSPEVNAWVHTLEHGRIILQYRRGTSPERIAQLEALLNEPVKGAEGYHMVLMENTTNMPYEVAGVAWTRLLGFRTFNDRGFDALRAFRDRFVDKAPEFIP